MEKPRKVQIAERLLFGVLLIWLGGAGALYELFRYDFPGWGLVVLLTVYMCIGYLAHRAILRYFCRNV